jgi:hypothetical protein
MVLKSAFLQSCNILLSPLGTIMTCSSIVISIFTYQFVLGSASWWFVYIFSFFDANAHVSICFRKRRKRQCASASLQYMVGDCLLDVPFKKGKWYILFFPLSLSTSLVCHHWELAHWMGQIFRLCGVVSLPKIINITFCILWKRKIDYVSETCFSFIRFWSIGGSVYGEVLQTCEKFGTIRRARIAMYVNISWPFELFWVIEIGWT